MESGGAPLRIGDRVTLLGLPRHLTRDLPVVEARFLESLVGSSVAVEALLKDGDVEMTATDPSTGTVHFFFANAELLLISCKA